MKKFLIVFYILILFLALAACKDTTPAAYVYEPSDDFTKISVSFYGDSKTARGFSFFTSDDKYIEKCAVHLDPAEPAESSPVFDDDDNIYIDAGTETTELVLPEQTRHYALAQGLSAGTKYFYRVGSREYDTWSDWGYFVTDDGDSSFSFLHITDSQALTDEEFAAFRDSLTKAYQNVGTPEFIVTTGDLVEFGFASYLWDNYFNCAADLFMTTTMAPVSGNHELIHSGVNYHFYLDLHESLIDYSYEYGDALFIVLDTNVLSEAARAEQINWLKSVLETSDKKWKIAAFHKAPFSSGTHADDFDVEAVRNEFVPVLAEYGVDLVLNGHDHVYARTFPVNGEMDIASAEDIISEELQNGVIKKTYVKPQGVFYVINRCIGIKFYNKSNDLNDRLIEKGDAGKIQKPVFSQVTIEGGTLTYTAYEYDRNGSGEVTVLDSFAIEK